MQLTNWGRSQIKMSMIIMNKKCTGPTATGWHVFNSTTSTLYLEVMIRLWSCGISLSASLNRHHSGFNCILLICPEVKWCQAMTRGKMNHLLKKRSSRTNNWICHAIAHHYCIVKIISVWQNDAHIPHQVLSKFLYWMFPPIHM